MTKNKAKIPTALGRLRIALFGAAAASVTLWAIAGTAHGQALDISGSEQPAAGRWQRLVNQPAVLCDTALLLTDGIIGGLLLLMRTGATSMARGLSLRRCHPATGRFTSPRRCCSTVE